MRPWSAPSLFSVSCPVFPASPLAPRRGIKLSAPQSGHGGKTPYEQALEYNNVRDSEIPPLDEGIKSLILI